ncbi:MarR family winged helix-turn-helix transcriptional regulator [Pseudoxanthomonas sp.]|uniref:MarR family winged helix-turn-helix transcriptional regulator n=1 Tax=Pseudoxanthomonas sp. TaxID=1871049 RepID=UPI003F7D2B4D
MTTPHATLGTLLRTLIDQLDSAVAEAYSASGLDYKPRFTPIIRALSQHGPARIKDIADGMGVSHSAVSQTISALVRARWVKLQPGEDSRERIAHLTPYAKARLPLLEQHWANTAKAAASLNRDIGLSLEEVLRSALKALQEQSFEDRIRDAAQAGRT